MKKRVLILGVGSFAYSLMVILNEAGAETACFLTREYGHHGARSAGKTWLYTNTPSPLTCIEEFKPDLIIPMSINWATEPWADDLIATNTPVFCPTGEALRIEVQRSWAEQLCREHGIPTPESFYAKNKLDALEITREHPLPFVIKNPFCSPFSPIHTIVCESAEETVAWLDRVDYAEGVFLQEYMGVREAGHFVFVANGEIISVATNQEYKRAFTGNLGPVAGAPMGGIVEVDPDDRYGLAKALIEPLKPWFSKTSYHGPLQVTAVKKNDVWYPIEYNTRLGVTSGAMFLRMMENPVDVMLDVAKNTVPQIVWKPSTRYGCSITLAGYGYPYYIPITPKLPVTLAAPLDCDLWWNEVERAGNQISITSHAALNTGHRVADVIAFSDDLDEAISKAYDNIRKIRCLSSYYRTDVGESLWPPGEGY